MSDPVSNAEIEDVLSSIRRLVSGEVEASKQAEVSNANGKEPVAKLILTADFRVPDSNATVSKDVQADEISAEEAPAEPDLIADEIYESEPAELPDADAAIDVISDVEAADKEIVDSEPNENDIEATHDHEDVSENTMTLESTIADLEAAVGAQAGEWEPDGSGFEEDPEAEEIMTRPVQDWVDITAQNVEAEIGNPDFSEPIEGASESTDPDAQSNDLLGEEVALIDEEALREMVSEIVRQELQGALGERITRNVRKLVRREINRVLSARDFD